MTVFDYSAGAGLYPCKTINRRGRLGYKRFDSVAEALRFAIEDMPASLLGGSVLEVEEARFDGLQMRKLYEAEAYPLTRRRPETYHAELPA
ncbi:MULTISPECIES: hypothetical protein [unclassified Rhizobium]|uniref:hypothetical protein n=1 Tax=unclassified Rhizobium TaxID=2613769 RepID=UPI001C8313E5|nr:MULTISPECIES: hypothetical protein [unclassified Rhizobium]MBX5224819.1 hypothetical protein [Rhizobium sp. NLR8a]MBX5230590.1 hypothetical protein [Rhizobium sp. NLR9b]MBX5241104.1 hypothetical protein [Rhizobium sp. NLR22b]MBX5291255.1 hypothetical protein [Rhizobium sp. NLR10b]